MVPSYICTYLSNTWHHTPEDTQIVRILNLTFKVPCNIKQYRTQSYFSEFYLSCKMCYTSFTILYFKYTSESGKHPTVVVQAVSCCHRLRINHKAMIDSQRLFSLGLIIAL
jgi:hypothetical protein